MRLIKAKPSEIVVPEIRVKSLFDEETKNLLGTMIKGAGYLDPILVQKIDDQLVLVDGENRLEEIRAIGDSPIELVLVEGDMVDLYCRNLLMDHLRGKHRPGDMVRVIGTLSKDHGLDSEKIRERTGMPRDYVERLIKISEASPEVRDALDQGAVGVGVAYQLARLPAAIMQEEVLAKSTVYRLKVDDVKELVDATLAELGKIEATPPPAYTPEARPAAVYKCEGCQDEIEPRYLRPAMVCPNCFSHLWRLGRAAKEAEARAGAESPPP